MDGSRGDSPDAATPPRPLMRLGDALLWWAKTAWAELPKVPAMRSIVGKTAEGGCRVNNCRG